MVRHAVLALTQSSVAALATIVTDKAKSIAVRIDALGCLTSLASSQQIAIDLVNKGVSAPHLALSRPIWHSVTPI